MGNGCSKRPITIELEDKALDPAWLFKRLQQDLQAVRYTNVHSLGEVVVDGCTVAIAKRQRSEGRPPKKTFVKCHNHISGRHFDSASAKCEMELLNRLSKDPAVCKHLPRLERTVWLDSRARERSQTGSQLHSDRSPHEGSIPANSTAVLMLEFDRRAGKLLAAVSKEGMRLNERQAGDMCLQLLRILQALHALHLHHGHIGSSSLVLTSTTNAGGRPRRGTQGRKRPSTGAFAAQDLSIMNPSLSDPSSLISRSDVDDSDAITDEMTSWLLPGFPTGVDSPRVTEEKEHSSHIRNLNPDSARGSTFDAAQIIAEKHLPHIPHMATPDHNPGRSATAVAESVRGSRDRWQLFGRDEKSDMGSLSTSSGVGMDLTRVAQQRPPCFLRSSVCDWLVKDETVNEAFEGLGSVSSSEMSSSMQRVHMVRTSSIIKDRSANECFVTANCLSASGPQVSRLPGTVPEESFMCRDPIAPPYSQFSVLSGSCSNVGGAWWVHGVDGHWNAQEMRMVSAPSHQPVTEVMQSLVGEADAGSVQLSARVDGQSAFTTCAHYVSAELGDSTEMFPFASEGAEDAALGGAAGPIAEGLQEKVAPEEQKGWFQSSSAASALQDSVAVLQKASIPPQMDAGVQNVIVVGMAPFDGAMPAQMGANGAQMQHVPGAMPQYVMHGGMPYMMHNGMAFPMHNSMLMPDGTTAAASNGTTNGVSYNNVMAAPGVMHMPPGIAVPNMMQMPNGVPMPMPNGMHGSMPSALQTPNCNGIAANSSMAVPNGMHMPKGMAWGAVGGLPMMQPGAMQQPAGAPGMPQTSSPTGGGLAQGVAGKPLHIQPARSAFGAEEGKSRSNSPGPRAHSPPQSRNQGDDRGGTTKWSFEGEDKVPSMRTLFPEIEPANAAPVDWAKAKRDVRKHQKKRAQEIGSLMSDYSGFGGTMSTFGGAESMLGRVPPRATMSAMTDARVMLPGLPPRGYVYAGSDGGESQFSHRSKKSARSVGSKLHSSRFTTQQVFDATMEAGGRKHKGKYARSGVKGAEGDPDCPACNRLAEMCTDCRLRATKGGLPGLVYKDGPAVATAGKKGKVGKETREKAMRAAADVNERPVHVLMHMHGVTSMESSGGSRLLKVHKDTAAVGAAVLLAITGETKEVSVLQRHIRSRHPASKDASWMLMSAEARSLIEGLIMERYTPEEALQQLWLQHHARRAAKNPKVQPTRSAFDESSDNKMSRKPNRKPPQSTSSSPLTMQHIVKQARTKNSAIASSPRLRRHESGASLASQASRGTKRSTPRPPALTRADSNFSQGSRTSTASRAAGTPQQDNSFLAAKVTEERIDAKGKKHVVTTFKMPSRASSGTAPTAARVASGPTPPLNNASVSSMSLMTATGPPAPTAIQGPTQASLQESSTQGSVAAEQTTGSTTPQAPASQTQPDTSQPSTALAPTSWHSMSETSTVPTAQSSTENPAVKASVQPSPQETAAQLQQELFMQLQQQQMQVRPPSPNSEQPLTGPSAVSRSPEQDTPYMRAMASSAQPQMRAPGSKVDNALASSCSKASLSHGQRVGSESGSKARIPNPGGETGADKVASYSSLPWSPPSIDGVPLSPSHPTETPTETPGASAMFQTCHSVADGRDGVLVAATPALGGFPVTESVPVAESARLMSQPMPSGMSASGFGDSGSTASVWWRAPWTPEQKSDSDRLMKPSTVKAKDRSIQCSSSGGVPEASPPNSANEPNPRLALRSPPTPVPLLFSTSAATMSPVQQSSQGNIHKSNIPSPSAPAGNPVSMVSPGGHSEKVISASTGLSSNTLPSARLQKPAVYNSFADIAAKPKKLNKLRSGGRKWDSSTNPASSGQTRGTAPESGIPVCLDPKSAHRPDNPVTSTCPLSRPTSNGTSLICERSESVLSTDSSRTQVTQTLLPAASAHQSDRVVSQKLLSDAKREPSARVLSGKSA